jgi:hypothetical protein
LSYVQLLEGRYANSLVSGIGITENGMIFRVNFEKFSTVYGVEVNESKQAACSLCQAKDGRVFICNEQCILEFHAKKFRIITEQKVTQKDEKIKMVRTNTKGDIIILKSTEDQWLIEFYKQL